MLPGFESVPRYREQLERLLGEELEFIPPGIPVDGPTTPRDWAVLRREWTWCVHLQATTGAGIASGVALQNPASSQNILVITKVRQRALATTAATTLSKFTNPVPNYVVSLALTPRLQDGRTSRGTAAVAPIDTLLKQAGAGSAIDTGYEFLDVPATGVTLQTPEDFYTVCRPGQGLLAEAITLNTVVDQIWYGYVRPARSEELQGEM